jgi:serine kinase of HPr protein (carbohydrate metabolism regulator)
MYTEKDILIEKGHIMTKDKKYYLEDDDGYSYWHKIKSINGSVINIKGHPISSISTSFCFRSDITGCLKNLNDNING